MVVLLLFAFLSGLVTIAAPCIWPLLPIVLSTSSLDGHRRPLGLTFGILISFGFITLSVSYLVHLLGLNASLLRTISVVVLVLMGATLLFPPLTRTVEALVSRVAGRAGWSSSGTGFWPGFVSGLPLGVVWAPCAGPILATIATLAATRTVGVSIVLVTIAYLVGIGIPLFTFSYAGQHFVKTTRVFSKYTGSVQMAFGLIIVVTAGLILFNWDTRVEADLLDAMPSYANFLNRLEGGSAVTNELNQLKGTRTLNSGALSTNESKSADANSAQTGGAPSGSAPLDPAHVLNVYARAPDLAGINQWLNLPAAQTSLSLSQLRGKVVLIDFWTYTCINCIRTLPHVSAWYDEYKDDGLVVIGVHTPEFEFEHDTTNVKQAIMRFKIKYPVAQDNDYATWKVYGNAYWPAEYLIDKDGNIRRADFGEGQYDKMNQAIRELLAQAGGSTPAELKGPPDNTPTEQTSPETYLGANRMKYFHSKGRIDKGNYKDLQADSKLQINSFDFSGDWDVGSDFSESGINARLDYNFEADHVYLVMHKPANGNGSVRVFMDGAPIDASSAGTDVLSSVVTVDSDRLYDLVDLKGSRGSHIVSLELTPGIDVFAFTFG